MSKYSCEFFATRTDLLKVLDSIEAEQSIKYSEYGMFDSATGQNFNSARDIKDFGISIHGEQNHDLILLILPADVDVKIRDVPQRHSGIKYFVDQELNKKSIVVKVGGEHKGSAIIAGQIGTVSDDSDSISLFKLISKEVHKHFKKIKTYYVGENAEKALDDGLRLTASIRSPMDYDLKR